MHFVELIKCDLNKVFFSLLVEITGIVYLNILKTQILYFSPLNEIGRIS